MTLTNIENNFLNFRLWSRRNMSVTKQKSQISFARSNWGPSNCWCWWRSLVKLRHSTIEIFPWKKKCQRRIYFPVYIQIRPLFKVINPKYINTNFYSMYLGYITFPPFTIICFWSMLCQITTLISHLYLPIVNELKPRQILAAVSCDKSREY